MPTTIQTIQMDAQAALDFIKSALPILEATIPAVGAAAGPIGLGVSAAALLLPLLAQIPIGTVITAEEQQALKHRVQEMALLDFSSPAWQKQP
jgi:ABC-type antimicrobial peptide transport system permease subunit